MKKIMIMFLAFVLCGSIWNGMPLKANEDGYVNTYQDVEEDYPSTTLQEEVNAQTNALLPKRFDARDYGWVTSVKSQGSLGTCWAYTTIAAAETSLLKQGYVANANEID